MTSVGNQITDIAGDEDISLAAAVAQARQDRRGVPHDEMRPWFLRLEQGEFDAPPPVPRIL